MSLDSIDKKLLNRVQWEFPLTREPYADLGRQLGIDESEAIYRLTQLKTQGIVRQISPVLAAQSLGYQTTLVAMRVTGGELARAEQLIGEHPGVSHGYEREHYFNLWFTLATPASVDMETELGKLTRVIKSEAVIALPTVKVFKIGAYFDMLGDNHRAPVAQRSGNLTQQEALSATDKLIINELQQDLPLAPAPFSVMAARIGMDVTDFLVQCQSLRQRGIIRRFGASVNHYKAGFKANAMACWVATPDAVDAAGQKLASLREVSHCYERKTNSLWRYNLFAMIHTGTRDACQQIASDVSHQTGLTDHVLLFSTKEFKKARVKYPV